MGDASTSSATNASCVGTQHGMAGEVLTTLDEARACSLNLIELSYGSNSLAGHLG